MGDILVVDDEPKLGKLVAEMLELDGHQVQRVGGGRDALSVLNNFAMDVVVTDLRMPEVDGLAVLSAAMKQGDPPDVVLMTGHASTESAVEAMKRGAADYLSKPFSMEELRVRVERLCEQRALRRRSSALVERLTPHLVAESAAMQATLEAAMRVAKTATTVLLLGESGTGKSQIARRIHYASTVATGPLVEVHCAALPEALLESELFGHEKGAFTGAMARRPGYFELADGGTIFLDEIAEMSSNLQAKYLRVLQDSQVRRVGGHDEIGVDVRVVAATNRDVVKAVQDGTFREDLYYRVNVLTISLPPLRRRPEDIALLADAFIAEFNEKYARQVRSVDGAALKLLNDHAWPGNVRELRNIIERAVVSCEDGLITPECLPLSPLGAPVGERANVVVLPLGTTLDDGERELILRTLQSVNNNKTRAAEILGTTPKTLHNKARRWREMQLDRDPGKRA